MKEFKRIKEITDLTTWTVSDVVYSGKHNPIIELPNESIVEEAVKILNKNKCYGWNVERVVHSYTKETSKNETGFAGKFWLVIEIWLTREVEDTAFKKLDCIPKRTRMWRRRLKGGR